MSDEIKCKKCKHTFTTPMICGRCGSKTYDPYRCDVCEMLLGSVKYPKCGYLVDLYD